MEVGELRDRGRIGVRDLEFLLCVIFVFLLVLKDVRCNLEISSKHYQNQHINHKNENMKGCQL